MEEGILELKKLMKNYEATQQKIADNRQLSRTLLTENQKLQKDVKLIKRAIIKRAEMEVKRHGSLWEVSKITWGKDDRRFYLLYSIIKQSK